MSAAPRNETLSSASSSLSAAAATRNARSQSSGSGSGSDGGTAATTQQAAVRPTRGSTRVRDRRAARGAARAVSQRRSPSPAGPMPRRRQATPPEEEGEENASSLLQDDEDAEQEEGSTSSQQQQQQQHLRSAASPSVGAHSDDNEGRGDLQGQQQFGHDAASTSTSSLSSAVLQRQRHSAMTSPEVPLGGTDWLTNPDSLVGKAVVVLWSRGKRFRGVVTERKEDEHHVLYDDGDRRWYDLRLKTFWVEGEDAIAWTPERCRILLQRRELGGNHHGHNVVGPLFAGGAESPGRPPDLGQRMPARRLLESSSAASSSSSTSASSRTPNTLGTVQVLDRTVAGGDGAPTPLFMCFAEAEELLLQAMHALGNCAQQSSRELQMLDDDRSAARQSEELAVGEQRRLMDDLEKMSGGVSSLKQCSLLELEELHVRILQSREAVEAAIRQKRIDAELTRKRMALCVICMENERNTLLRPCNHLCACETCVGQLRRGRNASCPICRTRIAKHETVFSS